MTARWGAALVAALAVAACDRAAEPGAAANEIASPANVSADAPSPLAAQYEPWGEPACHMVLKRKSDGMHLAWVQGSEYGVSLNTHLDSIAELPNATDLGLRLRADGDPKREVPARGQRGDSDSDSSTYVEIILDAPQRALIDGAERIAVMREGKALIELPVDTLADLQSVAEECTPGGPGRYVEE
jgi:hypothetical protein